MASPLLRIFFALAAVAAVLAPWWLARHEAAASFPGFALPASPPAEAVPFFVSETINPEVREPKAHSGTLVEMADGRLVAAWYAGSGEGARDVAIRLSSRGQDGTWSEPRAIFRLCNATCIRSAILCFSPMGRTGSVCSLFPSRPASGLGVQ